MTDQLLIAGIQGLSDWVTVSTHRQRCSPAGAASAGSEFGCWGLSSAEGLLGAVPPCKEICRHHEALHWMCAVAVETCAGLCAVRPW
jgi:hypothetical protein